jgi:hypothetical protein
MEVAFKAGLVPITVSLMPLLAPWVVVVVEVPETLNQVAHLMEVLEARATLATGGR